MGVGVEKNILGKRLKRLKRALLDAAFPAKCMVCGMFYSSAAESDPGIEGDAPPQAFSKAMAPFFCPKCCDEFPYAGAPACSHCGKGFKNADGGEPVCDACRKRPKHFHKARAFGIYDGSLKTALHQLKYHARTQLAQPLGNLLFNAFQRHWSDADIDLVVSVPLHRRKFRQRGFNQAFLLVRRWPELAARKGVSFSKGMIQKPILKRTRETGTQVGMNRGTRRTNIRHAFTMGGGIDISGKNILLVDDVYTTGATAEECAVVLRHAGAARVDVLTLAQTVRNL